MSFCSIKFGNFFVAANYLFHRLFLIAAITFSSQSLLAAEEHGSASKEGAPAAPPSTVILAPSTDYCVNIAKAATETRYAIQTKTLEELEKKIEQKIALLEELNQQNMAFEARQKERIKIAQKAVVDIYSKMKPDVAAGQLELLDPETATSILGQLNVRAASTILNEMKSPVAAVLTAAMADAAKAAQP
jgi:flagellar motility protein MotE (MotC chaperone)